MFLLKVCQAFKKHSIPYAIVGGHAVSLHGAVRGTLDVDFIIKWTLKNLEKVETALEEIGLYPRVPIKAKDLYEFRDEYIKNRNLIAWNFINPSDPSEQIDIITTFSLENMNTKKITVRGQDLIILSKQDLIKMKRAAGRKQDLLDIEALEKLDEK